MAEKACHAVDCATQFGLTQALGFNPTNKGIRMKKAALAAMLFVITSVAHARFDPPTGFRDIAFGSAAETLGAAKLVEESGDFKCFQKANDNLLIGTATINEITYCYYKNQLEMVLIKFDGYTNFSTIKSVLAEKYGSPVQTNRYIDSYWWGLGQPVTIKFDFSDITNKGELYYRYGPVADQQKSDELIRNRAARDDV